MRIEITKLKVGEINKLGENLKGDWFVERVGEKVFLVKQETRIIRPEDVVEVV